METQSTECPVCGCLFHPSLIDQHVNSCLNQQDGNKVATSTKRKSNEWSFFKRETRTTGSDRLSTRATSAKKLKTKAKAEPDWSANTTSKTPQNTSKSTGLTSISLSTIEADVINVDDNDSDDLNPKEELNENNELENTSISDRKNDNNSAAINDGKGGKSADNRGLNFSTTSNGKGNEVRKEKAKTASVEKASMTMFTSETSKNKKIVDIMKSNAPLAEKVRPQDFDDYIGQGKAIGKKSLLHSLLLNSDNVPSMILWGPPGCGKTTLAKIIAHKCQQRKSAKFVSMSATSASVSDVKEVAKVAQNDLRMFRKKTILFLDEIHRFNKLQQDALLPHVENGIITLIGATTENPSFQVNGALLSRCRVIVLEKLEIEDIKAIIKRACRKMGVKIKSERKEGETENVQNEGSEEEDFGSDSFCEERPSSNVVIEGAAVNALAGLVDGDARTALNGLQMAVEARLAEESVHSDSPIFVTLDNVKEGLQRSHVLYDRNGEEHYNMASALIKSMRGSDDNAALYWMTRMLVGGEDPLFIARRLVVFASEDVGLADPLALSQAVTTFQACQFIGRPECEINLAQCAVYLARAPKSVESYMAFTAAKALIQNHEGPMPSVPLHLRNAPTKLLKSLGCGKGYIYPPGAKGKVSQDYLPAELLGTNFFDTTKWNKPG